MRCACAALTIYSKVTRDGTIQMVRANLCELTERRLFQGLFM